MLRKLKENGIKLKVKKCDLSKKEVKYLGWIVSQEGYRADPENINPIVSFNPNQYGGPLWPPMVFPQYLRNDVS